MATNYEILTGLSKKQMAAFINSLVKKEVSRYIDWNAWLNSEDPEPPYIGEAAFMKKEEEEIPCYLIEENDTEGERMRTVFMPGEKGSIRVETLAAQFVRKATESIYPAAPLPELSEEEIQEVADESEMILEELLIEAEKEADEIDDLINESLSEDPERELIEKGSEPEEEVIEDFVEEEPVTLDDIIDSSLVQPDELKPVEEDDMGLVEPEEEPEPETEAESEPAAEPEPEPVQEEETKPEVNPLHVERMQHRELEKMLFEDEEETNAPEQAAAEAEPEQAAEDEKPAEEEDDILDMALLAQLESEVLKAENAEAEATSSLKFDDLWSLSSGNGEPEPFEEDEEEEEEIPEVQEEDEIVDFFDEQDRAEARGSTDYHSRGRIEMLKESLFDDEEEPPLGTGDLVFMETTAIEIDPDKKEIPEAADIDEGIAFADVRIPKQDTEPKKQESTNSLEIGLEEDADSFFEKLKSLSEAKEDDQPSDELDLDRLKKESAELLKKKGEEEDDDGPSKTPEEEERDFRSDTLAQLLIDKKKTSMLYDPNDPEDQELPTIAFSAINTDEENMF